MTEDKPLEKHFEALFSDTAPAVPDGGGEQQPTTAAAEPAPQTRSSRTFRAPQLDRKRLPRLELPARFRWVLATLVIVVVCAVLLRTLLGPGNQARSKGTPLPPSRTAIPVAAVSPAAFTPTAGADLPRTTIVGKFFLPVDPTGTPTPTESTQSTAPPTSIPTLVPAGGPPAVPRNLLATPLDSTRIRLTWSDNSDDESGFRIHDGQTLVATTVANTISYTISDLSSGSFRCYRIQAFNDFGGSVWTDWACAATLSHTPTPTYTLTPTPAPTSTDTPTPPATGQFPATPSNLRVIPVGSTRVRLDWQDNASNEAGFVIREGEKTTTTIGANAISYTAGGLQPATEYCYTIQAFNDDGASVWSSQACATTPQMFVALSMFGSGNTFDMAWGDCDNDGAVDLAVANDGEQNYLYINRGDTFSQTARFGVERTWSLAWGDYDDDGYLDVAVGNGYGSAQNFLFINNGDGSFSSSDQFDAASTDALAWGDYDDDGDLDLAIGNEWDQQNYLFVNNGEGAFTQVSQFGAGVTRAVDWGDYDGDGDLDLAVGNHGQNYLFVNQGDTFGQVEAFGTEVTNSLAWVDYDRDGDLDLAVGNGGQQQNHLYINDGDGAFSASVQFGAGNTYSVAWGDYDNDGDPDLAVGNFGDEQNYLFKNNGDGTFAQLAQFGAGSTTSVAWGDYDNDGDLDLAVGNALGQQNYLYINQHTALTSSISSGVGQ